MKNIQTKEEVKAYLKTVLWGIGVCVLIGVFMAVKAIMKSGVTP